MGRKRWRERRPATRADRKFAELVAEAREYKAGGFVPGVVRCGHPFGNGSTCMTPAGIPHVHEEAGRTTVAQIGTEIHRLAEAIDEEQERRETEELLNLADRMVPAKGLAEAIGGFSAGVTKMGETLAKSPAEVTVIADEAKDLYRRPTYAVLRAAAAERAQFTTEQAQAMLSAALGTRPHLAARVIDKLGPVLAGELARAVDTAVESRITGYLSAERAELNRLYQDQSAKLEAEREQRGRSINDERWTTPSRLA